MNTFPKNLFAQFGRFPILLLVTTWAVSACSGSSDSVSGDNQQVSVNSESSMNSTSNESNEASNSAGSEIVVEENTSDPASNDIQSSIDVATPISGNDEPASDQELPDSGNSIGADPLIQNQILVVFDITVPAYQSNELHLEVVWGDLNLNAGWVGDELWTVSSELPTDTEELLTVSFFDNNGAVELASFSQQFRTGSNAAEAFQISADQFDSNQFDADGDSISNIDELIAGTDPLTDDSVSLEIRDTLSRFEMANLSRIMRSSAFFESSIPDERPYFEDIEEIDPPPPFLGDRPWSQGRRSTIDIDATGNGTFNYFSRRQFGSGDSDTLTQEGIRTRSEDSIHWSGSHQLFNGGAGCSLSSDRFDTQTTRTAQGVVTHEGEQSKSVTCSGDEAVNLTYSLTGVDIDESDNCEATSGSISVRPFFTSTQTYTKAPEDTYWHVYREDRDGQFIEEFLLASIDVEFYCQHRNF